MKKFLLATVALVALGATVPALAADLPARTQYTKAPAYAAPLYNWTGFYLGGHIGGVFSGNSNFGGLTTGNNGNGRFLGGLQGGADYQFNPNWVIGAEAEYSWIAGNNGSVVLSGVSKEKGRRSGRRQSTHGADWKKAKPKKAAQIHCNHAARGNEPALKEATNANPAPSVNKNCQANGLKYQPRSLTQFDRLRSGFRFAATHSAQDKPSVSHGTNRNPT